MTCDRSGELNAKQRELAELQALAQRRLKSTRANLADGMKAASEVRRDLEWSSKRVRYVRRRGAMSRASAEMNALATIFSTSCFHDPSVRNNR